MADKHLEDLTKATTMAFQRLHQLDSRVAKEQMEITLLVEATEKQRVAVDDAYGEGMWAAIVEDCTTT